MFEQSLMNGRKPRPWTFSVSTALQLSLVGGALLVPLLRVEALPPVKLTCCRVPLGSPVVIVGVTQERSGGSSRAPRVPSADPLRRRPVITAPTRVPDGPPRLLDEEAPFVTGGASLPSGQRGGPPGWLPGQTSGSYPLPPIEPPPVAPPKPAQPAAAKQEPVRVTAIGGKVSPPRLIHGVRPQYPPLAQQARIGGKVEIEAILAVDGTVQSMRVTSGHPLLVRAAAAAVAQWRYQPTLLNGMPVEVVLNVTVNFALTH